MKELIQKIVRDSIAVKQKAFDQNLDMIVRAAQEITLALKNNHKVILFGNGGSAADSQHIAAEFIGRFQKERRSLPALALTTDTSALTALGNDYGFDVVFARQLEGLGQKGDIVIAISTSGNSKNVLEAVKVAKQKGIKTIALTGEGGGKLAPLCDLAICVPSTVTARIQETHICISHCLCELIENNLT